MTIGAAFRLLAVMVLWAACFPLITIGLDLAPHLAFAALRAALAGVCLIALGALCKRTVDGETGYTRRQPLCLFEHTPLRENAGQAGREVRTAVVLCRMLARMLPHS